MEAVPRLPMLKVEMKENPDYANMDWMDVPIDNSRETLQTQIKDEIRKHIQEVYGDDPDKYKDCVNNLLELQNSAYRAIASPDFEGCNTLKKYYGQLHFMKSRFPFTGENALNVSFGWTDAFTGQYTQHQSFVFEECSIIFNLGASHSYLGSVDNRTSEEGTKVSCVHFQCAAGFFQYLADHLDTTLSPDTSQFMLKLFVNIMLGQGQECLLEKSMQDNRKNSIVAKIAQKVVEYYEASVKSLTSQEAKSAMGDSINKIWTKLIQFKVTYYRAITKFFLGSSSWDQEKYGEGVSYCSSALDSYQEAVKLCKQLKGDFKSKAEDALKYSSDVFGGKYESVRKDNEFIYHDRIPDKATLPDVKGASLVKPLPFDLTNPSVTGPDIFKKLVPMEAHLAASSYSEEKAQLLRKVIAEVDDKNMVLDQYKNAIELDPNNLIKVGYGDKLDPTIIEHCAALSVDQSPITELTKAMKDLSGHFMDIDNVLGDIIDLIEDEELETKQVQDICGKTVDSTEEIEVLKKEVEVCKDVHEKAGTMNDDLHTAMKIHISNLKIVAEGLDAVKEECKISNTSDLINDEDNKVIESMNKLCLKVSEMVEQRSNLVAQLRSEMEEDDVTSALMTKHGMDSEDLFAEELKKHDVVIGYINQNLSAQDNILAAVTETNVDYTKIRKVVDSHREKVDTKCGNLLLSCTGYQEALERCLEGSKFFLELLGKVKEIHEKTVKLNDKNVKARKKILDKHEAKKPPPRPSAPKPKTSAPVKPVVKPGIGGLTSSELQDLGDEMEEFNDPAFLKFLQMSGGLPAGMNLPSGGSTQSFNKPKISPSVSNYTPRSVPQPHNQGGFARKIPQNVQQPSQQPINVQQPGQQPINVQQSGQQPINVQQPGQQPINVQQSGQQPINVQQPGQQPFSVQQQPVQQPVHIQQPGFVQQPGNINQTNMAHQPAQLPSQVQQQQQPTHHHQAVGYDSTRMVSSPPAGIPVQPSHIPPGVSSASGPPQNFHHGPAQPNSQPTNAPQYQPSSAPTSSYSQNYANPVQQNFQPVNVPPTGNYQQPNQYQPSYPAQPVQNYQPVSAPQQQVQNYQPVSAPQQPVQNYQPVSAPQQPVQSYQPVSAPQLQQPTQNYQPQSNLSNVPTSQFQQNNQSGFVQVSQQAQQTFNRQGTPLSQQQPNYQPAGLRNQPVNQFQQGFQDGGQGKALSNQPLQNYQQQQSYQTGNSPSQQFVAPASQHQQSYQQVPQPHQNYQQSGSNTPTSQQHQIYQFGPHGVTMSQPQEPVKNQPSTNYQQQQQLTPQRNFPQSNQPVQQANVAQQNQHSQQANVAQQNQNAQQANVAQQRNVGQQRNVSQQTGQDQQINQPQQQPSQQSHNFQAQNRNFQGHQVLQGQNVVNSQAINQQQQSFQNQNYAQGNVQSISSTRIHQQNAQVVQGLPQVSSSTGNIPHNTLQQNVKPQLQVNNQYSSNVRQPSPQVGQVQMGNYPVVSSPNIVRPQSPNIRPAPTQSPLQSYQNYQSNPNMQQTQFSNTMKPNQNPSYQTQGNAQNLSSKQQMVHPVQPNNHRVVLPSISPQHKPVSAVSPQPQTTMKPGLQQQAGRKQSGEINMVRHGSVPPLPQNQPTTIPNQFSKSAEVLKPISSSQPNPMPAPMQPTKPSADLEGLMYTPSTKLLSRISSTSADELLSGTAEPDLPASPIHKQVLVPTKVDDIDEGTMVVRRIEELAYHTEADLMKFKAQTEEFHQVVSTMLLKPSGSLCQLDKDWKKLSELQEIHARQLSTAIGRCSTYKNRFQDILPFDQNRVILKDSKDDYINASLVDGTSSYCPRFIATQSPLSASSGDFWTMVHEQQVNLIIMLVRKNEIPKKCAKYWPEDRNIAQKHGPVSVTFTTSRTTKSYIERTFTLKHVKSSLPRSVTQLQYIAWPEHGSSDSSSDLLSFMRVVYSFYTQQRSLQWPVVVHCENGVSHTGTFCASFACIQEIDAGLGIPNIFNIVENMRRKRKYFLQEKVQYKFVHDLVFIHACDLLKQRGVEIKPSTTHSVHVPQPTSQAKSSTFDVFASGGLSSIKASVEKMTIRPDKNQMLPVTQPQAVTQTQTLDSNTKSINIDNFIGNNVSDLVQGAINANPVTSANPKYQPTPAAVKPDLLTNCTDNQKNNQPVHDVVKIQPVDQFGVLNNQETNQMVPNILKPSQNQPYSSLVSLNEPTPLQNQPYVDVLIASQQKPGNNQSFTTTPTQQKPTEIRPSADAIGINQQTPLQNQLIDNTENKVSILDQMTPESFTLGVESKDKKKISKADFFKSANEGIATKKDPNDPFGDLDPFWSLK